jgi:hypothetical protein
LLPESIQSSSPIATSQVTDHVSAHVKPASIGRPDASTVKLVPSHNGTETARRKHLNPSPEVSPSELPVNSARALQSQGGDNHTISLPSPVSKGTARLKSSHGTGASRGRKSHAHQIIRLHIAPFYPIVVRYIGDGSYVLLPSSDNSKSNLRMVYNSARHEYIPQLDGTLKNPGNIAIPLSLVKTYEHNKAWIKVIVKFRTNLVATLQNQSIYASWTSTTLQPSSVSRKASVRTSSGVQGYAETFSRCRTIVLKRMPNWCLLSVWKHLVCCQELVGRLLFKVHLITTAKRVRSFYNIHNMRVI